MFDTFLPVVQTGIGGSLEHEIGSDEVAYIKSQLARLDEENPSIAYFIRTLCKRIKKGSARRNVAMSGIVVYRMLESQAEANRMEQDF